MKFSPRGWALLACLAASVPAVWAGPQTMSTQAQDAGLETPWTVRKTIAGVLSQTDKLRPLFAQLDPQQWSDKKGAPGLYVAQRSTAQRQLNDLTVATNLFSQKVESLSLGLDLYFRLEALDVTARSLQEGAKAYADRATADKLAQLIAADFTSREQLQNYLRDLATSEEENFKIADEEAQRCRGTISREAPAASSKGTRKR
ncbi:MAG TPA: hypothetical protein VLJ11_13575 [Bryobacteraceae bacterium]|nr:hypothetical protein [Bryobacteraceae bacterium]